MSDRLKKLVPKLIQLVTQLSAENASLKQELATALSNPADKAEAEAATKKAQAAEELNKSLTTQIKALEEKVSDEAAEDEDLAGQIEPYLKTETETPKPLEVVPPAKTEVPRS